MTVELPRPQLPQLSEAVPVEVKPVDLVSKTIVLRALNQLVSLVSGARIARSTDELRNYPLERCMAAWRAVLDDAEQIPQLALTDAEQMKRLQSTATKIESVGSLIALAKLAHETEW